MISGKQRDARASKLNLAELIVLQGTSFCNLNCSYCDLSVASRKTRGRMSLATIERFFTELFESRRAAPNILVIWHSGEPLTLPPSYYDEAISLILKIRNSICGNSVAVTFDIQTNGVLINEPWCDLFKRYRDKLSVGVSCDGPADLHDAYRQNWMGRATFAKTLRGMEMLEAAHIPYNVIAVITSRTLTQPDAFYEFFNARHNKMSGFHFNVLADADSGDADLSYSPLDREAYYRFFRRLLELTRQSHDNGSEFRIRNFAQTLARILRSESDDAPCYVEENSAPLKTINLDANGNVTTFYAGLGIDVMANEYGDGMGMSLGNIFERTLNDMAESDKLSRIISDFETSRAACEAGCEYFGVCTGGFELTKKRSLGRFDAVETTACLIHVKTMVDAVLDDIGDHLNAKAAG